MGITEKTILEQFPFWEAALRQELPPAPSGEGAPLTVVIGCGTSYNLALSIAALANEAGHPAIAVPGGEWLDRPATYWPNWRNTHVVALSRSGETTETVKAVKASRAAGVFVTAITCEEDSALAKNCDRLLYAPTHPLEGIVMTSSASLMLLLGLRLFGYEVGAGAVATARWLLDSIVESAGGVIAGRSHFVYLGGGPLYGVSLEAALKLQEMSQVFSQAFHPLEYRHGPISLLDERTVAVILYGAVQSAEEAKLATEMAEKGAFVVGFGGPGELRLAVDVPPALAGLVALPALQWLGEQVAQARGLDTVAPRHLTKVVTLA